MSQSYKIVTTNLGRTAVRFALAQGTNVRLTHMAVGDGGGQDIEPMSSMTELVRETFRAQINEITFDAVHPDMFTAELFIPQSVGGFYIREVGLFMEDGTLFAVGSMPLTEKPDLSSGSASDLLIKIIVRVLDASTISISIDPAQVLATRDYVDRMDRDRIRAAVEAHDKEQAAHDYLARKTLQIKAGTGLSGGGTLEADRTLTVKYGTTSGTACQGNDVRLGDARTPTLHKSTHQTGGADALAPADIGAAAKTIQIVAGTGLSGGGNLETNRTLTVEYGTMAGTACQGNDARLSNARTPTAHASTATTYGAANDTQYGHAKASGTMPKAAGTAALGTETAAFARGDHVHPAQTAVSGNAGTSTKWATKRTIDGVQVDGSANTHHYGACSTAAATVEKAVSLSGFVLATGARVTVRFTVTNTAASPTLNVNGTGAKAIRYRNATISAGYLAANRTYEFVYDGSCYQLVGDIDTNTTYAVATQTKNGLLAAADKKALDYGEAFRLSMIGVPRFWRSTTLPVGHVWANGDLVLFADWPELKKIYDGGGFNGMLLAYNANAATIAANLGKWRPNAANPTGLYVPKLGDQFFRGWTGTGRAAGSWQGWASAHVLGQVSHVVSTSTDATADGPFFWHNRNTAIATVNLETLVPGGFTFDNSRVVATADENRPVNIALPVILYLGTPA